MDPVATRFKNGRMDVRSLTRPQIRWIERCAAQLKQGAPLLSHMEAVVQAYELCGVWPDMDPVEAARVFLGRELVVLPPPQAH